MSKEYLFKNKDWLIEQINLYGTVKAICENTNNAPTSIRRYIDKFDLKHLLQSIDPSESNKTHSIDKNYFEIIDTEHKAYWLGFLMADGNVYDTGNKYCIRMTLKNEDIYILEKFRKDLNTDVEIKIDKYNRGTLRVFSKKMFYDLQAHGIVPNKTGKESIPSTVPEHLIHHFIRGFFDGDGTIYTRSNRARHKCTVGWCCSNYNFMIQLNEILNKYCGFSLTIHSHKNNCYESKTESYDYCKRFVEFIYKDATIGLIRKYNRAHEYLDYTCTTLE